MHQHQLQTSKLEFDRVALHAALKEQLPGYLFWRWANEELDKRGTDLLALRAGNRPLHVDLKVRKFDPAAAGCYDDLFIETASCCESGKPGWAKDPNKTTDLVVWIYPTGRCVVVSHRGLRRALARYEQEWRKRFPVRVQKTPNRNGGYTSECLVVPRRVVERAAASFSLN